MTLYDIKPKFQDLLRPIVRMLFIRGVTANQVTVSAAIISMVLGAVLMLFPEPRLYILLPIYLFVRMALNAIDGMLAREFNQQSRLGAILNEVGDIIADAALYLAFAFVTGVCPWLVVLVVLLSWLTEFCGVMAQTLTGSRNYRGPMGKSDRAFVLGALGLFIALWPQYIVVANIVFGASVVLLAWTSINRCRSALEVKYA
ncbi:CDP-alcohol phosphatidyltransferase family protein [Enterobacter bugandensis]|uniref:CDP-alcohol phosphatidyltransferase family protein n=1 Tax=Enterobacter bugandensis TaxID=881260 RepID=A0AA42PTE4_9ENTR|nr:CDP-alcohol phosphatidyltransferase family protein [Enterobacter bugandensis]MDH1319658.1 CDP-alcohol phosphatidyltransferase family protein [Enterobacter bugandensis]